MTATGTTEPTCVTQGEQIAWTRTFSDYPADEWTLQYRFRGPDTGFNITATADGTAFDAVLTSVQSAAADAGDWGWQAWATNIADITIVLMIDSGKTKILLGFPSSTAEIDLRSPAKIALEAINAAIASKASADQLEYEISTPAGSHKIKRLTMKDLLDAREVYAKIVANENTRERLRNGGPFAQRIGVRVYDE